MIDHAHEEFGDEIPRPEAVEEDGSAGAEESEAVADAGDTELEDSDSSGALVMPEDFSPAQAVTWQTMTPAMREKTLRIRAIQERGLKGLMESRYELGQELVDVKNNPKKYGSPATTDRQLLTIFESTKTMLVDARRLAERYTPQRFQQLTQTRLSDGQLISLTHLVNLLMVPNNAQADKVLDLCIESAWSSTELRKYILKMTPAERTNRADRKRPRTLVGFVEQINAASQSWLDQYESVWSEGLTKALATTTDKEISNELLDALKETQDRVVKQREDADFLAAELSRAWKTLRMKQYSGSKKSSAADRKTGQAQPARPGPAARPAQPPRARLQSAAAPDDDDDDDTDEDDLT